MKKQSSIDWLISEFEKQIQFTPNSELDIWFKGLFPKAKQMNKEEIMDAYYMGDRYSCCGCYDSSTEEEAEDYYIEIFEEDARKQN